MQIANTKSGSNLLVAYVQEYTFFLLHIITKNIDWHVLLFLQAVQTQLYL